jgi:hypothetical protein
VALVLLVYMGVSQLLTLQTRVRLNESERAAVLLMTELVEWNKVLIESRRTAITAPPGDAMLKRIEDGVTDGLAPV